jgi:glycerophosphoryl diester phosphodiesterase
LAEVFALVKGQVPLNLELKDVVNAETLLDLVQQYMQTHNGEVILSSFDHPLLAKIKDSLQDRSINTKIKVGALVAHTPLNHAEYALALGANIAAIDAYLVDAEFVQHAHTHGLKVWCYTVNCNTMLQRMIKLGVDAIFTNDPGLMKASMK